MTSSVFQRLLTSPHHDAFEPRRFPRAASPWNTPPAMQPRPQRPACASQQGPERFDPRADKKDDIWMGGFHGGTPIAIDGLVCFMENPWMTNIRRYPHDYGNLHWSTNMIPPINDGIDSPTIDNLAWPIGTPKTVCLYQERPWFQWWVYATLGSVQPGVH